MSRGLGNISATSRAPEEIHTKSGKEDSVQPFRKDRFSGRAAHGYVSTAQDEFLLNLREQKHLADHGAGFIEKIEVQEGPSHV